MSNEKPGELDSSYTSFMESLVKTSATPADQLFDVTFPIIADYLFNNCKFTYSASSGVVTGWVASFKLSLLRRCTRATDDLGAHIVAAIHRSYYKASMEYTRKENCILPGFDINEDSDFNNALFSCVRTTTDLYKQSVKYPDADLEFSFYESGPQKFVDASLNLKSGSISIVHALEE